MEWTDLKQLDTLIQQTKALGAYIEEIGVSGEERPICSDNYIVLNDNYIDRIQKGNKIRVVRP